MVKNRGNYYNCTNKDCPKGKYRAIRRSHWKQNHTCDFGTYSKFAYPYDQRLPLINRVGKTKKRSGKHAEVMCTNPGCPIKLKGKNYMRLRTDNWIRNHERYIRYSEICDPRIWAV